MISYMLMKFNVVCKFDWATSACKDFTNCFFNLYMSLFFCFHATFFLSSSCTILEELRMHDINVIKLLFDILSKMSITVATNDHISIISLFNVEVDDFKLLFNDHHDVKNVFKAGLRNINNDVKDVLKLMLLKLKLLKLMFLKLMLLKLIWKLHNN